MRIGSTTNSSSGPFLERKPGTPELPRMVLTACLWLLVVSILSLGVRGQSRPPQFVVDATRWDSVSFDPPPECEGTPEECAARILRELKIDITDSPKFSTYYLGEADGTNLTVVLVSHLVTEDDSVAGILYRVELSLGDVEDRSYKLEALGRQFKCARGRKGWSKKLCP